MQLPEEADLAEAQARAQLKIQWAAALGAAGGLALALSRKSPVILTTLTTTTSAAAAAGCFSVLQEGLRFTRHKHDAWNSVGAGAVAGAALVGIQAGPRYRLFGTLAWGTICGGVHLLHGVVQPRQRVEWLLMQADLLDPPEKRRQQQLAREQGAVPVEEATGSGPPADGAPLTEDQKLRRKLAEVRKMRAQELEELREASAQLPGSSPLRPLGKEQAAEGAVQAAEAGQAGADTGEGGQAGAVAGEGGCGDKPRRRWWWAWRS